MGFIELRDSICVDGLVFNLKIMELVIDNLTLFIIMLIFVWM